MLTKNSALGKLIEFREKLAKRSSKDFQKSLGMYKFSETLLKIAANVFSVVPSMLDIIVTHDPATITKNWSEALRSAEIDTGISNFVEIKKDIEYSENAKNLYGSINYLHNMSRKIDPLGILE